MFVSFLWGQFSIQSPPPPRLYTYAVDGCLEPLLVVLDVVVALHGGTAASADTASDYRRGLDRVVQAAAAVHSTIGFWKTYVHLERIYNAVEVPANPTSRVHSLRNSCCPPYLFSAMRFVSTFQLDLLFTSRLFLNQCWIFLFGFED